MNFPADIWPKVLSLMEGGDMTATTINTWFDDATPRGAGRQPVCAPHPLQL